MEDVNVKVVYCRICGIKSKKSVKIFSRRGRGMGLEDKILKCLMLSVKKSDQLPTRVCFPCIDRLDDFSQFLLHVKQAQIKLRTMLKSQGIHVKDEKNSELITTWKALLAHQERESVKIGRGKKRKRKGEVRIDDSSDSSSSDSASSSSTEDESCIPMQCWSSRNSLVAENESRLSDSAVKEEVSPGTSKSVANPPEEPSNFSGSSRTCRNGDGPGRLKTLPPTTLQISDEEVPTSQGNPSNTLGSIAPDCEQNPSRRNTIGATVLSPVQPLPETPRLQQPKGGFVPFYLLNVQKGVPASCGDRLPSQNVPQIEIMGKSTQELEESISDKNAKESTKSLDAPESAGIVHPRRDESTIVDKFSDSQNTIQSNQESIVETASPFGVQPKVKFKFMKSFKPMSSSIGNSSASGENPKNQPSNTECTAIIPMRNSLELNTDSDLSSRPLVGQSLDSDISQVHGEGLMRNDICVTGVSDSPSTIHMSKSLDVSSLSSFTPIIISNCEIRSHCNSIQSSPNIGDDSLKHAITLNMLSVVQKPSGPIAPSSLLIPTNPCISEIPDSEQAMDLSDQNKFQNVSSNIPVPQVIIPIADVGNFSGKNCSSIGSSSTQKIFPDQKCLPTAESHQAKQVEEVSEIPSLTGELALSTYVPSSVEGNTNYSGKESTLGNNDIFELNDSNNSCTSDIPPLIPASNDILVQNCDAEAREFYEKLAKDFHFSQKNNSGTVFNPLCIEDPICEDDFTGRDIFSSAQSAASYGVNHNHGSLAPKVGQEPLGKEVTEVSHGQVKPADSSKTLEWSPLNTDVNCRFNDPDYSVIKCCLCSNGPHPFLITLASASDHHKFIHAGVEEFFGCIKCEFTSSQLQDLHQHIYRGCLSIKNANSSNPTSDQNSAQQSSETDTAAPNIKVEPNDDYEMALSNIKNALRKVNMPRFRKLLTSYKTQSSDPISKRSAADRGVGSEKGGTANDQEDMASPKKKKSKLSDELSKMFVREGRNYLCRHCKNKFTSVYQVKLHISRHPGCLVNNCAVSGVGPSAPTESSSTGPVNSAESNPSTVTETGEMIFDIPRIKIEKLDSPPSELLEMYSLNENGMDSIPESVPPSSKNPKKHKRSHEKTHSVNLFQVNSDVGGGKNVDSAQSSDTPGTSSEKQTVESTADGSSIRKENLNEINVDGQRNRSTNPSVSCSYTPLKSSDASEPSYVNYSRQYRSKPIVKPLFKCLPIKKEDQVQSTSRAINPNPKENLDSEAVLKIKQEIASPSKPANHVAASPSGAVGKTVAYKITITKPSSLLPSLETNTQSKGLSTPSPKQPCQVRGNSNALRVIRPKPGFVSEINNPTGSMASPTSTLVTPVKSKSAAVSESTQSQVKVLKVPFVKLQRLNFSNEEIPKMDGQGQSSASPSKGKVSKSPSKVVDTPLKSGLLGGKIPEKERKNVPNNSTGLKKEKSAMLQQIEESIFGS